jgi:hypothetical protein
VLYADVVSCVRGSGLLPAWGVGAGFMASRF